MGWQDALKKNASAKWQGRSVAAPLQVNRGWKGNSGAGDFFWRDADSSLPPIPVESMNIKPSLR
jgi:hypothetical protein